MMLRSLPSQFHAPDHVAPILRTYRNSSGPTVTPAASSKNVSEGHPKGSTGTSAGTCESVPSGIPTHTKRAGGDEQRAVRRHGQSGRGPHGPSHSLCTSVRTVVRLRCFDDRVVPSAEVDGLVVQVVHVVDVEAPASQAGAAHIPRPDPPLPLLPENDLAPRGVDGDEHTEFESAPKLWARVAGSMYTAS